MATNSNTATYANSVANIAENVTATNEPEEQQGNVYHVSVKIPKFNHFNVNRWIGQAEAQFTTGRITSPATKFAYLYGSLPEDVVNKLSDAAANGNDYEALKAELIHTFTESKPELFDKLVNHSKYMDTKPSLYLRNLQQVASQLGVGDEIIRIKFLKGLPDDMRPTLLTYGSASLEEMARVADTLMSYKPSVLPVNNISTPKIGPVDTDTTQDRFSNTPALLQNSYHPHDTYINYIPAQHQERQLTHQAHNYGGRNQQQTDGRGSSSNNRPGLQPFHPDQRQKTCRHHIFYGPAARNCKPWCWLNSVSPNLNILPNSRPASRSNSPHRNTTPSPAPRNTLNSSFSRSEN